MWIGGRRRGGAKALADHLRRTDENESVKVLKIEGFAFDKRRNKRVAASGRVLSAVISN
jgi:translation elongation factor EF-Ts